MGLFGKKKEEIKSPSAPVNKVNADDIWNTPVKKKETVSVKESKYDDAREEVVEGVTPVDPEVLKKNMAELDKFVEERDARPAVTYHDFDTDPVHQDEVTKAQEGFEKDYAVSHKAFVESHKEDISVANLEEIDDKLKVMIEEHNNKLHELETMDYDFKTVSDSEVQEKMADLPYALKEEEYEHYKDIKGVTVSQDEVDKLGSIDHSNDPDEIGEVTAEQLAQATDEFEKSRRDKK
ncbi:MAG: hypothetical protein IIZ62_06335 [Ruminococcus sp.]|jgi:hypothetical protein|nr:hypothetical protein [Ruminococcus sp.]